MTIKDLERIKSILDKKAQLEQFIEICKNDCIEMKLLQRKILLYLLSDEDIKKEIREECAAKISIINYDLKYKYNITDVDEGEKI